MAQRMSRWKGKLITRLNWGGDSGPEQAERGPCDLGGIVGKQSLKETLLISQFGCSIQTEYPKNHRSAGQGLGKLLLCTSDEEPAHRHEWWHGTGWGSVQPNWPSFCGYSAVESNSREKRWHRAKSISNTYNEKDASCGLKIHQNSLTFSYKGGNQFSSFWVCIEIRDSPLTMG